MNYNLLFIYNKLLNILQESGHTFVSMDACFSLVKKRKDASNIAPLHDNKYFLNQDEVDVFVEDYGIKDKNPDKVKWMGMGIMM